MRIVCISDTHNRLERMEIPDGDVLLHAGDATMAGKAEELEHFNTALGRLPHPHKVFIAGNHDWLFQRNNRQARAIITHATYLEDDGCTVAGLRIWGSPWQPWFGGWAFNLQRGEELREKWAHIPDGIDILLTHGPPHGHGDTTLLGEHVGDEDLMEAVRRVKPRYHVFGHVHEGQGVSQEGGTKFINACMVDLDYRRGPAAVVVDA
ncbi:MAG: metallophosphatase domain-containing protein [Deltaproteobacteria bacterium]|nr:metallophosphatase domain-containing protein [Deltaproteobacteria bacterium]